MQVVTHYQYSYVKVFFSTVDKTIYEDCSLALWQYIFIDDCKINLFLKFPSGESPARKALGRVNWCCGRVWSSVRGSGRRR